MVAETAIDRHHNGPPDAERIELAALPAPRGRGRPSLYTPETADRICDRLADGESLKAICRSPGMPSERAVLSWAATRPEFRGQYDFAREIGRETIGHDVLAIRGRPVYLPRCGEACTTQDRRLEMALRPDDAEATRHLGEKQ
jgi:hypothetical protein